MLFFLRFAALLAVVSGAPAPDARRELQDASVDLRGPLSAAHSTISETVQGHADAVQGHVSAASAQVESIIGGGESSEAPTTRVAPMDCNPLDAVGDLLEAVPIFLSANGGFEPALAKAAQSLDPCTMQLFGQIVLGAGNSPLGSLCR